MQFAKLIRLIMNSNLSDCPLFLSIISASPLIRAILRVMYVTWADLEGLPFPLKASTDIHTTYDNGDTLVD